MANANQSWKYFDTKAKSWKKLPKDSYQKMAKKGFPIGIFWLSKGKETGSYKTVVNQKALPKGVASKFSYKTAQKEVS